MNRYKMHRRDFMKGAVAAGAGLGMSGPVFGASSVDTDTEPVESEGPTQPARLGRVPRKKLGSTGETVPILAMGGSQHFDPTFDRRLHLAFEMGINYFDTSPRYSNGEAPKALAAFVSQIDGREKVWISSKARMREAEGGTPADLKAGIDKSLEILQTDYLDLFLMHGIIEQSRLEPEFIKMGDDLKKSKKTRFFGFSCHTGDVPGLMEKAARVGGIDVIMFRYNFRDYGDMELNRAIDACKKAGIGLVAMKTQASVPEDQEKVVEFRSKNFTLPQAKLKAVWADERIDVAICEMTNVKEVMEDARAAMSTAQLAEAELVQLERLAVRTAPFHCRGCSHICESRIKAELKVADTLRYLMYYESYGKHETARSLYAALRPSERDPDGIDLTDATAACPQHIKIAERLRRAKRVLSA